MKIEIETEHTTLVGAILCAIGLVMEEHDLPADAVLFEVNEGHIDHAEDRMHVVRLYTADDETRAVANIRYHHGVGPEDNVFTFMKS